MYYTIRVHFRIKTQDGWKDGGVRASGFYGPSVADAYKYMVALLTEEGTIENAHTIQVLPRQN